MSRLDTFKIVVVTWVAVWISLGTCVTLSQNMYLRSEAPRSRPLICVPEYSDMGETVDCQVAKSPR